MAEQNCYPLPYGCDECYTLTLPYNVTLTVGEGLVPSSTVSVVLTAMNGNQYESNVVVNTDGTITLDTTEYPAGMFNQYAGQFDIMIFASGECYRLTEASDQRLLEDGDQRILEQDCAEKIPVTINGVPYNCMKLNIEC